MRARSLFGVLLVGVLVAACGSNAAHSVPNPTVLPSTGAPIASASAAGSSAAGTSAAATSPAATSPAATPIASGSAAEPTLSLSAAASSVGVPAGQVGTRAQIPWDQVGPGWFLVQSDTSAPSPYTTSTAPPRKGGTATLSLVSPAGARYVITTWAGKGAGSGAMNLADLAAWSGDGHHAVFNAFGAGIAIELDLTTGVSRQVSVPHLFTIGFTSPTGANLVAVEDVEAADGTWVGQRLVRLDLNGKPLVQLAQFDRALPQWLYSTDGATVYVNGSGGLGVVSNAGGRIRVLSRLEAPDADCGPVRWWDPQTILANCSDVDGSRLWLVPVTGRSATPLTPLPGKEPVLAGYDDAVRAGNVVFAEHLEGCGVVSVHRLAPSGVGTRIVIPQSLSNDHVIGAVGSKIAIASSTECGAPSWFGFYDPATNTTQKVVPDVPGELGVQAALAFP